jgi:tRNA(Ile2) C34 agmatinyltransferase TiaS
LSADLLPFARIVEHARPAGRGAELFLECGHKMTVAGDQRDVKAIPCAKCVAAFHEEQARRDLERKLYTILQETRKWVHCPDVLSRLDSSIETLRRRLGS